MGCNCNNGCGGSYTLPSGAAGTNGSNGASGQDGVSVTNANINSNGNLELTLDNGQIIDAGYVLGSNGTDGVCVCDDITKYSYLHSGVILVAGSNNASSSSFVIISSTISASSGGVFKTSSQLNGTTVPTSDFTIMGFEQPITGGSMWTAIPTINDADTLAEVSYGFITSVNEGTGDITIKIKKSGILFGVNHSSEHNFKFVIIG
jgi:hypothetical protein